MLRRKVNFLLYIILSNLYFNHNILSSLKYEMFCIRFNLPYNFILIYHLS